MIVFNYLAKDDHGKRVKGKVEAQSAAQATKVLRERHLVVISLKSVTGFGEGLVFIHKLFRRVRLKDLVTFTRQLSTMVASGLPLAEALNILQNQAKPEFGAVIAEVVRDVQGGMALADALGKHPVFPEVYVALVRAGEYGGVLDQVLNRMAENLERQQDFLSKTKGALVYPAIVIIGMVVVSFIMLVVVIPKLTVMYEDFGAELPLPTKILLAITSFMGRFWFLLVLGAAVGSYALHLWRQTPPGRYQFDKRVLRLPIIGPLFMKIILSEFARTLALLITAGIPIIESLNIVSHALGNAVIASELSAVALDVEKGASLAESLAKREVFPALIPQMVSVGEETGKLDEVLNKVSHYFETEAEQAIKNLTTAIEPLIMILLGLGVGFLIVAIILPIYNLTSQF